jgi:hypothetical protein
VRPDLGSFFDHDDRHVAAAFCGALLEADRGREAQGCSTLIERLCMRG